MTEGGNYNNLVNVSISFQISRVPGYLHRLEAMLFKANFAEKTQEVKEVCTTTFSWSVLEKFFTKPCFISPSYAKRCLSTYQVCQCLSLILSLRL